MKKFYAKHCGASRNWTLLTTLLLSFPLVVNATTKVPSAEQSLRSALDATLQHPVNNALNISRTGLENYPHFRTLNMLHADLLMAMAHQKPLISYPTAHSKNRIQGLTQEMSARYTYLPPGKNKFPQNILRLSRLHQYALLLDADASRLYLLKNIDGIPTQIENFYASIGTHGMNKERQGDNRTPTGIYHITSFLSDKQLPELYGDGAFPINYPNSLDKIIKRDGDGIWLHGMPRTLSSRPPRDSRGCIIVDNQMIGELRKYIEVGRTPILLAHNIHWLSKAQWQEQQDMLYTKVMQWKEAWESMDTEKYLAYYSPRYRSQTANYAKLIIQTRRNAQEKTSIRVGLKNLDLFIDPQNPDLAKATFDQDYRSNNYKVSYRKQQIWQNDKGVWKIIYEGKA